MLPPSGGFPVLGLPLTQVGGAYDEVPADSPGRQPAGPDCAPYSLLVDALGDRSIQDTK
jgi:hypothetical protein